MAVKQREAGIVRDKIHFNFLIPADHDHIFHHARSANSGKLGQFEAVAMKVNRMNIVAGIAHAQAVALAFF